jgi:hypothetical protein
MANTDFAQTVKDMMGNLPVDTSSFENLAKSQAALAEKMSAVAIEAAQKSTDLSARWMQETLSKLQASRRQVRARRLRQVGHRLHEPSRPDRRRAPGRLRGHRQAPSRPRRWNS